MLCQSFRRYADGLAVNLLTKMAQSLRPGLILMDIAMPEMDGLEAGRNVFLTKPIDMGKLLEQANYLVELDEQYRPFADQLRSLARNYESKALLSLVEQYLHGDSVFNRQE